jgi:hypothetical protein
MSLPNQTNTMKLDTVRGIVSNFNQRSEGSQTPESVWTFNIDVYEGTEIVAQVPVEMRGYYFTGAINNGNQVEVTEPWHTGELLRPSQVKNLTTGATIGLQTGQAPATCLSVWIVLLGLLVLVLIGTAIFAFNILGSNR